jgi:acyl-CoA thioester hydrolase
MKHPLPERKDFQCFLPVDVRWGDMDAYGHVNNIMYFRYFESARVFYFEAIGIKDFDKRPDVPVVARLELNYRAQVAYPARLEVGVRVPQLGSRSYPMECVMFQQNPDGSETIVADGLCVIVWIDKPTGRPVPLPDDLKNCIAAFEHS